MIPTKIFIIILISLLNDQYEKVKADSLATLFNDNDTQYKKLATTQTIQTIKGNFNEESHRLVKCSKLKQLADSDEKEKNAVSSKTRIDLDKVMVNSPRKINADITTVETEVFSELQRSADPETKNTSEDESIYNINSKTNTPNSDPDNYILDSNKKSFEFESLLINNAATTIKDIEDENEDELALQRNSTRRNFQNEDVLPVEVSNVGPHKNSLNRVQNIPNDEEYANSNSESNFYNNYDPNVQVPKYQQKNDVDLNDNKSEPDGNRKSKPSTKVKLNDTLASNNRHSEDRTPNTLHDPTKGKSISQFVRSKLMLMYHPREQLSLSGIAVIVVREEVLVSLVQFMKAAPYATQTYAMLLVLLK
ncbi:unnamed protein product [Leptidea sinapis]|uniref:Uncharacterized protein n=1 Tax=Leptidea sinapis TaxID=189913 RepID=A0A5E4Q1J5_9NEOP|nr:unnamed protein product [Leptidea sinapis]